MLFRSAVAVAEGTSISGRLDALARRHGRHVTTERSVPFDPARGAQLVRALAEQPPTRVADRAVVAVTTFPEADLVRLWLDEEGGRGIRLQIRPSGTEPKVKLYGEAVDLPASILDELVEALVDVVRAL